MTEVELIARAQEGDKEAYIELIRIHQQTVEKFAFQCGVHTNDLADVSQEVFVKLYRFYTNLNRIDLPRGSIKSH